MGLCSLQQVLTHNDVVPSKPLTADFEGLAVVSAAKKVDGWKQLTSDQRNLVAEKLEFVQAVVDMINGSALKQGAAVTMVASDLGHYAALSKAGKNGASALTLRNFRNWAKLLGWRSGMSRIDSGKREVLFPRYSTTVRKRSGDLEFWSIFARLYMAQSQLSLPVAYKSACDVYLQQVGRVQENLPSLSQVRYYYENHVAVVAQLEARHGVEYLRNSVLSYAERDWTGVNPGDCFIGDHRKLDVAVRVWDADQDKWISKRPWMTAWLDAKSLKFVGVLIRVVEYPNGVAIEDSLISAIRANHNIPPKHIYMDNGQDYRAKGFSMPVEIDGKEFSICKELNMKVHFSLPYNGRAKTIERMFKEFAGGVDKACKGYLGNHPGARPEWAQLLWKNPEELPNLQQFSDFAAGWMEKVYNATSGKKSKITGGLSPNEMWNSRRVDYARQMSDLDLYFATLRPLKATRKVGRGAAITVTMKERGVKSQRYECDALWPFFGKQVMVKIDVYDTSRVWAFTLDGKLIGECTMVQMVPALADTPEERALVSRAIEQQRGQEKRIIELRTLETGEVEACIPDVREMLGMASSGGNVTELEPTLKQIEDKKLDMDEREDIKILMDSERPSAPVPASEVSPEVMAEFMTSKFETEQESVAPEEVIDFSDFDSVISNSNNKGDDYEW